MVPVDGAWEYLIVQYGDALRAVTRFRNGRFERRMREDVQSLLSERLESEFN